MAAKGEMDGEEVAMDATFKNEFGRIEGNVKVNTPFEGYTYGEHTLTHKF